MIHILGCRGQGARSAKNSALWTTVARMPRGQRSVLCARAVQYVQRFGLLDCLMVVNVGSREDGQRSVTQTSPTQPNHLTQPRFGSLGSSRHTYPASPSLIQPDFQSMRCTTVVHGGGTLETNTTP